ncbi:MAG: hypothetical protein EZS28_016031 [Streblomastix strix]|uniref:Uncharacterized protein n=1 Tax=Streblomastix strix TaxID=222440 RepID=A0A5J4W0H2_9EUKA|nr:MAG: hypothetical protein EZS28_016031 [Streblomastix strix]
MPLCIPFILSFQLRVQTTQDELRFRLIGQGESSNITVSISYQLDETKINISMNYIERPNNVPDNEEEETASDPLFLIRKTIEFTQSDSRITNTKSLPITYSGTNFNGTTIPLNLSSDTNGESFIVSYCSFTHCNNKFSQGGAITSYVYNGVIVSIYETEFMDCFCDHEGGAIYIQLTSGSEMHFESCTMNSCYSGQNGGGLFILILSSNMKTAVYLQDVYILSCSSQWNGGGIYIGSNDNTALFLIGQFTFDNCSSIDYDYSGGGIYLEMTNPFQGILMQGDYTFKNCYCNSQGGGMFFSSYQQKKISINCTCLFQNCTSKYGGGMLIINMESEDLTQFAGNFTFEKCSAQLSGGGLFIESASNGTLLIDNFTFIKCSYGSGGGIFFSLVNDSEQFINGGQFINCAASIYGGGISVSFTNNSKLILDKLCEFNKCVCLGCGGAIYANINYSLPFQFNISNTLIQECEAKADTIQTSPTGYGGGIFLTGTGDYDPSTESLDFRGMNINGNYADCGGQSLYIVMPNIIELCESGLIKEYIRGNYSDQYSDYEEIEGISTDQITFNSLSLESVQQQQAPLQQYWVYIPILTKVTATLNVSDDNPLQINLEGYNMIEGQFTVKIVELGQINQKNKLNQKQSQINSPSKSLNSNLTIAKTNSLNYNKINYINNYDFEFIYPPDDGSSEFIHIDGDPQSLQTASFGMKDISWFDYDNKSYGVFISNDGRIFTGINGRQDEAYPLEVILVKLEISNITKVTATINVSNVNQPLLIDLEGYNMIEGQFTVKIVELEIINDGSSEFIHIDGDPQSLQTASFEMKDISWFDYDNKHYGIDSSLHWEQQNQLSSSEKDIDPQLKKDPPIYPEVEQSHYINDEEQQIIIDWDSLKKINIPSFKNISEMK